MTENIQERLAELPQYLGGHLLLSTSALLVGILISVPLGVWASRSARWSGPVLGAASLVQTIPSMALLALMVPILGGMIGFVPAFLALTLYSVLPVLRNTLTGIQGIDAALIEAAEGVGMTDRQRLLRVELPLAAPVIIAGIRTATVWVVGTTTLSTPVGAPSLGNYIFAGLQTRNSVSVLFGCIFAALLAVVLDQLIRLAEDAARTRNPARGWAAAAGLALVIVGGLAPLAVDAGRMTGAVAVEDDTAPVIPGGGAAPFEVIVGAKTFTEQYILSDVLQGRLQTAGARVSTVQNMGSTILFDALRNNQVDVYVDYTGTIWATIMKRDAPIGRHAMFVQVAAYLLREHGVLVLGRLGFENAYGFAMRADRAAELGIRSIGDLAPRAGELSMGGDPEFFSRPEWVRTREAYGLQGMRTRGMDSTFMYGAVRDGNVDVIGAYTTDGRIAAFDLQVLEDPRAVLPPYDAVVLLSPEASADPRVARALAPLLNAIDNEMMRAANKRVDLDGAAPSDAADSILRALDK